MDDEDGRMPSAAGWQLMIALTAMSWIGIWKLGAWLWTIFENTP